ncbi:hypothetical protein F5Y06DRAFT_291802 [Hypoxylon sp. FL0890]|nr:hypothetical protein F5Y06DRAFT_291802 [Hypoxylon sp. FL0890]
MSLPPRRKNRTPDLDSEGYDEDQENTPPNSSSAPPGISEGYYNENLHVNHPPPGLVRVTTPIVISHREYRRVRRGPTRVIDQYDVSLFSNIVEYFDTGLDVHGNHIVINIPCPICGDSWLEVPPAVTPRLHPEETPSREPMAILPCGHFFGARCLDRWIRTRQTEQLVPDCPLCRFPLVYEECGHPLQIRHYDARFPRRGLLPLTLPEGGVVPYHCQGCRVEWVQFLANRLAETLYPRDIPQSAFIDLRESGPYIFREKRALLRRDVLDTFLSTEQEFSHW